MLRPSLERRQVKQPSTIEQYVDRLPEYDQRTIIQYDARWTLLLNKYSDKTLSEALPLIVSKVLDDVNNKSIKSSTFRLYRAAIYYGLGSIFMQIENDTIDEDQLENGLNTQILSNLYRVLRSFSPNNDTDKTQTNRTSSLKKKSFPYDFYSFLKQLSLNDDPTQRASHLWDFVQANLIVGLRPAEWLNANIAYDIRDQTMVLIVRNAKNSYGRANGDQRILRLLGITFEKEGFINKFYTVYQKKLREMARSLLDQQKKFQTGADYKTLKKDHIFNLLLPNYEPSPLGNAPLTDFCTADGEPQAGLSELYFRTLQREMHSLYNRYLESLQSHEQKRVTLYSTRHQCIANAKASKINAFEIAAFFGHSSKETSSRHYGRAWSGWSAFSYRPALESILAVSDSEVYLRNTYGYTSVNETAVPTHEVEIHNNLDLNY